jgi:hypothetical protein
VVLLYPTYRSVAFPLDFLWEDRREAEAAEVRDTLQRIAGASKNVGRRLPNVGCREALGPWEEITDLTRRLVGLRAESGL